MTSPGPMPSAVMAINRVSVPLLAVMQLFYADVGGELVFQLFDFGGP